MGTQGEVEGEGTRRQSKMAAFHLLFLVVVAGLANSGIASPEEKMKTDALIKFWGYPCEVHEAETKDGYHLTMHRIPHGKSDDKTGGPRPVFLLQHTVLSSSADFVMNNENQSLGLYLADQGFDVWLGNIRGNTYSKKHKTLKPSDKKFWDFSIDEHIKYDIPAMIDHVLKQTKQRSLYYGGHSQGSMIMLGAMSEDPEMQWKVKVNFALAPITRMKGVKSAVKDIASWSKGLEYVFRFFGIQEFYPSADWSRMIIGALCKWVPSLCKFAISIIGGKEDKYLDKKRIPIYIAHTPAGTSSKNVLHYTQIITSGKFQKYDYGKIGNMQKYNQEKPPEYGLTKIHTPTVVFGGGNDAMAPQSDVAWVASQLAGVLQMIQVKDYSHMDFCGAPTLAPCCTRK